MSSVSMVSQNTELARASEALLININAAEGLQKVLKTNLGPRGTLKMLVGGAGDIKITKDGNVLLKEMQIQHPTASLIAKCAVAQDKITGDGTTSTVLFLAELLKLSRRYLEEGAHPRVLADGFDIAKKRAIQYLLNSKIKKDTKDHELLTCVARTSIRTKLYASLADKITDYIVDAVLTIRRENTIDLHMVEMMYMQHKTDLDTKMIKGLVLDHAARHPQMPKRVKNAFVLILNVSLEYGKPDAKNELKFDSAQMRDKFIKAERWNADERVKKIIELKRKVCDSDEKGFVVINQKGIDPIALSALAAEGIMALRRAKRRNMERLSLICGGEPVNSVRDLTEDVLGYAGSVYEHALGEEKFTFVEDVKNPRSCTLLVKGPNKHTILQIQDAIRDGLRAVKNTLEDGHVILGAGAFEVGCAEDLKKFAREVKGTDKLGVEIFANALLTIPKTLAVNSGLDPTTSILQLQDEFSKGKNVGLNIYSGEPLDPDAEGIYDNYTVKRQMLQTASVVATQLLLVDEILKAGKSQ